MQAKIREQVRTAVREPGRIGPAVIRRVLRRKPWIEQGEYVTFAVNGFVAAPSPPILLARHNYEAAYVRRLLGDLHATRSLEVGCGFGRLSPIFAEYSDSHEAVDINVDALETARQCYPDLNFSPASVTDLPFENDSFDLVTTWTVLQHVRPSLIGAAVSEILRVLASQCTLLLCEATRFPDMVTEGTWDRERSFYEEAFAPLRMVNASYITELDRIPGTGSPGEVMLFTSPEIG